MLGRYTFDEEALLKLQSVPDWSNVMPITVELEPQVSDSLERTAVKLGRAKEDLASDAIRERYGRPTFQLPVGSESELISAINDPFPRSVWRVYETLKSKSEAETIINTERHVLVHVLDCIEDVHVRRLEHMASLARMRGVRLEDIIAEYGNLPLTRA
jgi:hypothetical protein